MDMKKEITRLASETGIEAKQITEEVDLLMGQGHSDLAAVAIWKSKNNNKLGGQFIGETSLIVVGIDEYQGNRVREVNTKNGQTTVANIQAFVLDPESNSEVLCAFTLWGDNSEIVESIEIGTVLNGNIKILGTESDGLPKAVVVGEDGLSEGKSKDMRKLGAILKDYGPAPLADIADYVGSTGFFTGIVGDTFEVQNGMGYSISGEGSNPIAVYPISETEAEIGDEVIIGGRVYMGNKGIGIGSGTITKV